MTHIKLFFILIIGLFLIACGSEEKPHYLINDAPLRVFQTGDVLSYTVLDNVIFNYSVTLVPKDKFSPTGNIVKLLYEQQEITGNETIPFVSRYFQQNDDGDLIFKAINNGGDILWLVDDNNELTDDVLYPADITSISEENSFSRKLQFCDENRECTIIGKISRILQLNENTETVTTNYAVFEAYKMTASTEIEIFDTVKAGDFQSFSYTSTQWFYPLLGVIRYIDNSSIIGDLSQTNISIDQSFKKI